MDDFEVKDNDLEKYDDSEENVNLERGDVSVDSLQKILNEEFDDNEIDDGDLHITREGLHIYIMVDAERECIRFNTRWQANENISENRAARITNDWNGKKCLQLLTIGITKSLCLITIFLTRGASIK